MTTLLEHKRFSGTDDQIIYVEHIHAQKSPFWVNLDHLSLETQKTINY